MTLLRLLALATSVAVFPAAAEAHTTIIKPGGSHFPYQQWVDEARVPTPEVTLSLIEGPCPQTLPDGTEEGSCTAAGAQTIWFEWWMPAWSVKQAFYHEIGHNFDYGMPEWARARYMVLIGRIGQAWREPDRLSLSAHELFAESYAACAVRPRLSHAGTVGGGDVIGGWQVHNRVCRLISTVG